MGTDTKVAVVTANDLLGARNSPPLKLDSYQRGFSWDQRRMRQLVDDLARHVEAHRASSVPYYLGTVLIHEKGPSHFVIDGQQRIAALTLLWKALGGGRPERVQFEYSHPASQKRLKDAYQALQEVEARLGNRDDLFRRIGMTQFVTSSEDEAFSFFDSQNSRGVPLGDTDLLKAFHLDAIGVTEENGSGDDLQKEGAQRWEQTFRPEERVTADWLFKYLLTPARRAADGRLPYPVDRRELLDEFRDATYNPHELARQRRSPLPGDKKTVPCFPSPFRAVEANLQWSPDPATRGWSPNVGAQPFGTGARDYPFSLRQPLSKGMGFFLYAERYAALARELSARPEEVSVSSLSVETDGKRIFNRLHWVLYSTQNNDYLARAFLMAGLLYVDRFEEHRLGEFALWLEHLFGSVRVYWDHLHEEHPLNAIQQSESPAGDLFTLLSNSFIPDPVIEWTQRQARAWQTILEQPENSGAQISGGQKCFYIRKSAECFGLEEASGLDCSSPDGVYGHAFQKKRLEKGFPLGWVVAPQEESAND